MARHFLYLTNTRAVSITARGGRLVSRREFAVSDSGIADFERHVRGESDVPMHLITDVAEEDLRLDTIPHLGGRDREAVIARKLQQVFRGTPYRYAHLQGREVDGRRDDRVLYTAVINPEVLQPWMDVLERIQVPLAGIHSAAMISAGLLSGLGLSFPHMLLVTLTPGGALRQTYFRGNDIRFSRLTPVDLEEGQTLGSMLAEETARTWQYLDSLRNFSVDDRLEVCVLAHARDRPAIEPALRDFAQMQYRLLDIEQVAAKIGLKPPPLSSSAEEILVHVFLKKAAPNHFATPEQRRYATLRSARLAINQVSAVVLVAGLVWGGFALARAFESDKADLGLSRQLQAVNREYDEITRSLPTAEVGGTAMRDAVAFYNGSLKGFPSVLDFVVPLSKVLGAHPRVRLLQFAWITSGDAKAEPAFTSSTLPNPPPVRTAIGARAPEPAAAGAPPGGTGDTFSPGRYQVALVEATVRVEGNDFRGALAEVERLATDLGNIEGVRVSVLESPLDTRPLRTIQGRLGEAPPQATEARFVLRLVRERLAAS